MTHPESHFRGVSCFKSPHPAADYSGLPSPEKRGGIITEDRGSGA